MGLGKAGPLEFSRIRFVRLGEPTISFLDAICSISEALSACSVGEQGRGAFVRALVQLEKLAVGDQRVSHPTIDCPAELAGALNDCLGRQGAIEATQAPLIPDSQNFIGNQSSPDRIRYSPPVARGRSCLQVAPA